MMSVHEKIIELVECWNTFRWAHDGRWKSEHLTRYRSMTMLQSIVIMIPELLWYHRILSNDTPPNVDCILHETATEAYSQKHKAERFSEDI
jgi:hypothetical protein